MCSNYRRVTSLGRLLAFFGVERHRDCLGIEAGAHHNLAMKAQSGRRGLEAAEQLKPLGEGNALAFNFAPLLPASIRASRHDIRSRRAGVNSANSERADSKLRR
jgi:hypothetical protein